MSLEIYNNTLLKLIVRRGTNVDRQRVLLDEGELGYTTDTKKLYVGDGSTYGGVLVGGNAFKGVVGGITTVTGAVSGDLAFDNNTNTLYTFNGGDPSVIGNWTKIGGVYTAANNTITVANNQIAVGTISGNNISTGAVGNSLKISNNQISLNETEIKTNKITGYSDTLQLPSILKIGDIQYTMPTYVGSSLYLKTDIDGTLKWAAADYSTNLFVSSTASQVPVGSIMPYVSSNAAPYGWLLCNGGSVSTTTYADLFGVVGYSFGGAGASFNLPNFINKTLYGVSTSPAASTVVRVASGATTSLSATGTLYIIKAIADRIASVSMTVNSPLTAQINNVYTVGSFNPLSGDIKIGLPIITTPQQNYGSLNIDAYGRVTTVDTLTSTITKPGAVQTVNTTPIVNPTAKTSFLQTPVNILALSNNQTGTYTICCFPYITTSAGVNTTFSIPSNAKAVILDSYVSLDSVGEESVITAAPNPAYLNGTNFGVGTTEYIVNKIATRSGSSSTQVTVPLSATNGNYAFGLRCKTSTLNQTSYVRVVGYTV